TDSTTASPSCLTRARMEDRPSRAAYRANWLFAGSLRAGKRAAAIMSLIRSAQLNGHDPYVYLKDVLERLPTQRPDDIATLLPHRWAPVAA
ncbi:transposase domain-containing protein, partial [Burkholderia ubonensis]|uniref:transposase domain-containing protein n=1 Tax=Burkholderia ubonensis TaxID=101571 RepID=UPI001E4F5BE2